MFGAFILDGSFPPFFLFLSHNRLTLVYKAPLSLAAFFLVDLVQSLNYQTLCDAAKAPTDCFLVKEAYFSFMWGSVLSSGLMYVLQIQ